MDVLSSARARTVDVAVVLDGQLLDEHDRLETDLAERLTAGASTDAPEIVALAEQLADSEERIKAAEIVFTFRGIGRAPWRKLMADNPPTEGSTLLWDPDAFPMAAMSASLVSPALDREQIEALAGVLEEGRFMTLWGACLSVNVVGYGRPESEAARSILSARHSSEPASDSGSVEAS